jgi:hypothetical protein
MRARASVLTAIRRDHRIMDRFWSLVERNEGDAGCWEWRGRCKQGCPTFNVGQHSVTPTYLSWFATTGELLPGGRIHVRCGNALCVRPSHLAWVVGQRTGRRLIAEHEGYVSISGVATSVDSRAPRTPGVFRLIASRHLATVEDRDDPWWGGDAEAVPA